MTLYLDTSQAAPGTQSGDLIQGGTFTFNFGSSKDIHFFLSAANNNISGQTSGQTVILQILSSGAGAQSITVPYGAAMNGIECWGYGIQTIPGNLPSSPNCDVRVVVADVPQTIFVTIVNATILGTASINISQVGGDVTPSEGGGLIQGFGGGTIDPRQIRALTSTDQITNLGSAGLPNLQDPSGNIQQVQVLQGSSTPILSKVQPYDSHNNPVSSAVGSGNTPIAQDSAGNLQHVPVLQGGSTPVYTKAQQYDANNYPLQTQGNVTSNGRVNESQILTATSLTTTANTKVFTLTNSSTNVVYVIDRLWFRTVDTSLAHTISLNFGITLNAGPVDFIIFQETYSSVNGSEYQYFSVSAVTDSSSPHVCLNLPAAIEIYPGEVFFIEAWTNGTSGGFPTLTFSSDYLTEPL